MTKKHKGQVIPVPEKREYAYQSEHCYPGASIKSSPSHRDHSEEAKKYLSYELTIHKLTDTAMVVTLHKERKDIVQQRCQRGAAITQDVYTITIDFAELCNRIFNPGCDHIEEEEAFPESIKQAMRKAYDQSR